MARSLPLRALVNRIESGVSPVCEERPALDGEPGVLTLAAITSGRFRPEHAKALGATAMRSEWTVPTAGAVLITRASGSRHLVGACAVVDASRPDRVLPDTAWQLHFDSNSELPKEWVVEFLRSPPGRKQILRSARGTSGIWKITKPILGRLKIPVPSTDELNRIVAFVRVTDERVHRVEALLEQKRAFKRALLQDLLTGRRRFPEYADRPWRTARLGDLFAERNERGVGNLPLLSVTADLGIIPREEVGRKDTSNPDKSKYKRVVPGDIAYNTMRMWQGVSALSSLEGIVSPAYTVVTARGAMHEYYAKHLFKLSRQIHEFLRRSQGLVDDTLNLKYPHFARVPVTFPPSVEEQVAIAGVLDRIDDEIKLLADYLSELSTLKRGLMQRLLSGEIEIPEHLTTASSVAETANDDS